MFLLVGRFALIHCLANLLCSRISSVTAILGRPLFRGVAPSSLPAIVHIWNVALSIEQHGSLKNIRKQ